MDVTFNPESSDMAFKALTTSSFDENSFASSALDEEDEESSVLDEIGVGSGVEDEAGEGVEDESTTGEEEDDSCEELPDEEVFPPPHDINVIRHVMIDSVLKLFFLIFQKFLLMHLIVYKETRL